MYVILGGAHNGKRKYTEKLIEQLPGKELIVCEGYLPNMENINENERYIISNIEQIILPYLDEPEEKAARQIFEQMLQIAERAELFCVCTDTSRGVVPLEKEARQLRDTCGRLYQMLCNEAQTVIRVWYGIPQILKGDSHGQD
ncbi:bifunctional adenosylcobinamide kinase/adenosylcobinamide-phosphate guanylyltransferase [Solibacillus sp. FSL W7-1324]|uniref:bifunctional adenosylcobinamide kinase/adenosylcobinamide-phosphate guanylyltransferase n=1 Tax=Solibacillus sp. FSL W7-1324 TaxID=2921701 RepID=UPI0030F9258A